MSKKHSRRVASEKIRGILNQLADSICESQDNVILALFDNSFVIHLDGATLNISMSQTASAKKGGAA